MTKQYVRAVMISRAWRSNSVKQVRNIAACERTRPHSARSERTAIRLGRLLGLGWRRIENNATGAVDFPGWRQSNSRPPNYVLATLGQTGSQPQFDINVM